MSKKVYLLCAMMMLVGLLASAVSAGDKMEEGFVDPPDSAKPWAYWWWLNSNASREGITRDLEEMKRQGIAGVLLFDAGEGKDAPMGPLFMSEEWRELFRHAIKEADRLGITVGVNLCHGWDAGGTWVTAKHAAKTLVWSSMQVEGAERKTLKLPRPEVWEKDYYRDVAVLAYPQPDDRAKDAKIKNWELKAARKFAFCPPERFYEYEPSEPGEAHCKSDQTIDLTERLGRDGRLDWEVPLGKWTILRVGYTLLGAKTKAANPEPQGYEIDYFSPEAMDMHFAETAGKMVEDVKPLAGETLKYVHEDSFEVCGPNHLQMTWTPNFPEEFIKRRGYDPQSYYPVLTGKIVDSREISNRFLWDYRRTIGDLYADAHFQRMQELAHKHGLGTHPESGGPFWSHIDALQVKGFNDIPMGEYWKRVPEQPDGKIMWADNYIISDTVRQAACAAHIYGRPVCQAEAFTSMGPNWEEDFYDLKDIGDNAFCAGLTRNVLCFYVHQPRLDIKPGYQWEFAGTHFDRNVTWWNQIDAWLTYLSRCQYLLKKGMFAADLLYYYGEDVPNYVPAKEYVKPVVPEGFDFDMANTDVLMNRLSVKDGHLVLPDGMSYRMLVLPDRLAVSPKVLRKIKELAEAGATVIGPKPVRSPGLSDYPQCDREVQALANELWGDVSKESGLRKVGKGRIIWGKALAEVFADDGVLPDFIYTREPSDAQLKYIHRTSEKADIYFISNQESRVVKADCVFRVAGKQPEIWNAVTGERWDAFNFKQGNGRTHVPLEFAPRQSWFVIFRKSAGEPNVQRRNIPIYTDAEELFGPWTVSFDPGWGGPESVVFEELEDWTKRPEEGIKYYSGDAVYKKTFSLPESLHDSKQRLYLNLGRVENVAEVRLNGKDLGVVWTAPWHVEITDVVQPTDNHLEITVVNLWPNRLIGDAQLPPEQRYTVTNVKKFKKDTPLMESGLLGPVKLQIANR